MPNSRTSKRKYVKKKLGLHATKVHYAKYRFPKPTIIPTQRGGKALAVNKTYYQLGRFLDDHPTTRAYWCAKRKKCKVTQTAEGKFHSFYERAPEFGCDNLPKDMQLNGKHVGVIYEARRQVVLKAGRSRDFAGPAAEVIEDLLGPEVGGQAMFHEASLIKTRMLIGLINLHKRGQISHDKYFDELVKLITRGDEDVLDISDES